MLARYKDNKVRYSLTIAYLILVFIIFVSIRSFWTPDLIFVAMLGFFIILGEGKKFLIYFLPFVLLLLSYEKLRSLAPLLNSNVHYMEMIRFDRWLFGGTIPTQSLQAALYNGQVQWYDFALYFIYMLHFVVPLILAVIIWRYQPKYYWRFVTSLLLLSYFGFLTYVAFPAAPPWLASEQGILTPPIAHISTNIWHSLGVESFSTYYKQLSPNLVAAVPSLHSAYPFLFALIIRRIWGNKWFAISMAYPIAIWFGVVYLGEHYVIDVLLGVLYAFVSYKLALPTLRVMSRGKHYTISKLRTTHKQLQSDHPKS
jgi:hypothetical protein